jgi:hypothetical protein
MLVSMTSRATSPGGSECMSYVIVVRGEPGEHMIAALDAQADEEANTKGKEGQ